MRLAHNPAFFSIGNVQEDPIIQLYKLFSTPKLKTYSPLDGQGDDPRDQGLELCEGNIPALVARGR